MAIDPQGESAGVPPARRPIGLVTDLYELTMSAAYLALGMGQAATFSLAVRRLPASRRYLVAAGLADVLERLSRLAGSALDEADARYLTSTGRFDAGSVERLVGTRFSGEVWAVREGRVVFAEEPLLEVQAPLPQAQLAETLVLNAMHYPTLVATKAARCVAASRGKPVLDFGMRRMPGVEASLAAARACYLAGFAGTSNVLAGRELGIPVVGTMAHSLVEAFPGELDAFRAYARTSTGGLTLLVDTYDTAAGIQHAIEVARELHATGRTVDAIRLDSGDLASLAPLARGMLDAAGLDVVRIVASGGLDEAEIDRLSRQGAPIDAFAVGTRVGMSADAPVLDMAYKLVAYDGRPCLKLSEGKVTLVGPKQVWRRRGEAGRFAEDRIAVRDEGSPGSDWEPLLEPVMRDGRPTRTPALPALREGHLVEMRCMPSHVVDPDARGEYPVTLSAALARRQRHAVEDARRREATRA
jgi:nicotinate phosphoribosyltransferase